MRLNPRIRDVIYYAPIPLLMLLVSVKTSWILFFIIGFVALWEFRFIVLNTQERFFNVSTRVSFGCFTLVMIAAIWNIELAFVLAVLSLLVIYSMERKQFELHLVIGQATITFLLLGAYWLRLVPTHQDVPFGGISLLGLALVITTFSDSAAYFVGKAIGRHKFAPVISPNKTWEGVVGGWIFGIIAGLLYCKWLLPAFLDASLFLLIFLFWALTFAGQLGDLSESWLKRHYGVKDSGTILGSHGGILDRFDSMAFILPLLTIFVYVGGYA